MNIFEPKLENYNLTEEQLKKYKIQTLQYEYISNKPYIRNISIVSVLIFGILNNGLVLMFNKGIDGFLSMIYIIPITIGIFYIFMMVIVSCLSAIFSFYHPLTKSVILYKKDLNEYNIRLKEYEEEQEKLKKDFWYSLSGHQFEHEVAKLFKKFGFRVEVTKGSDDKGVDINMWDNNKYIVVQCKAHKKRLSPSISRELYGTMIAHSASEAYLVTLEGVSDKSTEFILDKPIKIFDVNNLILMQEKINKNKQVFS